MFPSLRRSLGVLGVLLIPAVAAACSGASEAHVEGTSGETDLLLAGEQGSPIATDVEPEEHVLARVTVERSQSVDGTESAQAMAHFVELHRGAEETLEVVGLTAPLPSPPDGDTAAAAGSACRTDFDVVTALDGIVELELLEAGGIEMHFMRPLPSRAANNLLNLDGEALVAAGDADEELSPDTTEIEPIEPDVATAEPGSDTLPLVEDAVITLSPHAFPSVSSFAAGLVYTTRDRAAGSLPSDTMYDVLIRGGARVPYLELSGRAPKELAQVTLGGVPISDVRAVDSSSPLDLTWQVGAPSDIVYVELSRADDGQRQVICAFPDEAGSGSIASEYVALAGGDSRISIHRLRLIEQSTAAGDESSAITAELRFDFELSRIIAVRELDAGAH